MCVYCVNVLCVCIYIYIYITYSIYFENIYMYIIYTSCTLTTLHCRKVSFLQCCHMKIFNKIFTKKCEGCTHFCEILYINVIIIQIQHTFIKYIYIYAFSRQFYPKRLTVHSGYTFLSVCVPLELNPQPFALLTQCSPTEPQQHDYIYIKNIKIKLDKSVC